MLTLAILLLDLFAHRTDGRVGQQAKHLAYHPELHKPRAPGKPESTAYQRHNQNVVPQPVVDDGYHLIQFHTLFY